MSQFGIGVAVDQMKRFGQRVRRAGWNGKGMYLEHIMGATILDGTGEGTSTLPFVVMSTAQGDFVPWLCSQTDLLAEDWEIAE